MRTTLWTILALLSSTGAAAQTLLDAPIARGSYDSSGLAFGVEAAGDVAFVSDHASGILALDLSDPDLPDFVTVEDTPSFARNSAFADSILLVADRFSGGVPTRGTARKTWNSARVWTLQDLR